MKTNSSSQIKRTLSLKYKESVPEVLLMRIWWRRFA